MRFNIKLFFFLFFSTIISSGYSQLNVSASGPFNSVICVHGWGQLGATVTGGTAPYHYKWNPSAWLDNDTISNPLCSPPFSFIHDTTIQYSVIVTDQVGDKDTATINIMFFEIPNLFITSSANSDTICNGTATTLTVHGNGGIIYNWMPATGLSNINGSVITAAPNISTCYTVVANSSGCMGTTSTCIYVENCPFNILQGVVFNDINANGLRDAGENKMSCFPLNISPASSVMSAVYDTGYIAYVGIDNYTVTPLNVLYYTQTSNPNISFYSYTTNQILNVGLHGTPGIKDLAVNITPTWSQNFCTNCASIYWWGWPYINGGVGSYLIHYKNIGTDTLDGVIKIKYDSQFDNMGAFNTLANSDTILSIANDTLTWQYNNLLPGEERYFKAAGQINNPVLGNMLLVNIIGYPLTGDADPSNNYDTCNMAITASWDPNFKDVNHDNLTKQQINSQTPLNYTIHFQNTGNDTAIIVKVVDTLSQKLDLSTFEMISSSHSYVLTIKNNNSFEWKFNNIMLPDSGANLLLSNGFIKYKIKPFTTLNEGDSITNKAAIYFDNNSPIITNSALTMIPILTGLNNTKEINSEVLIYPNPANDFITIKTSDIKSGSILTIYDVTGQALQVIRPESDQTMIDIRNLASGIYFMKLLNDSENIFFKFIKQ